MWSETRKVGLMLFLLLLVAFTSLTLKGLTVAGIIHWLNLHPFITILFISYMLTKDDLIDRTKLEINNF